MHVGEADHLVQRGRAHSGGDAADDLLALQHQVAFLGAGVAVVGEREADQFAGQRLLGLDLRRAAADEERLGLGDRPGHVGLPDAGEAVGVLADDDVAFFEAQHALGFDAEGADAFGPAGRHQRVPQGFALACRHVDLIAELADEADPHDARRDAGDRALAARPCKGSLRREVDALADALQHLARIGPAMLTPA